jgi:hypothetical protein
MGNIINKPSGLRVTIWVTSTGNAKVWSILMNKGYQIIGVIKVTNWLFSGNFITAKT